MPRSKLSLYIDDRGRSRLVRSGFSWLAFLALPLWAAHRRWWSLALLSAPLLWGLHWAVLTGLDRFDAESGWPGAALLAWWLAESVVLGRLANGWHHRWLLRQRYRMTATELAEAELPPGVRA